jgi:beta-ribofuranosylaminobenzene 5'-phosphate synthase
MRRRIVITTGARLHFGLLSHRDDHSRNFGGVGLMVDRPRFRLVARRAESDRVIADEPYRTRVETLLARYRRALPAESLSACEIELLETIRPHIGLGSGTQLGMAVSRALALLAGEGTAAAASLAARVGRGKRSSIGIYGFDRGGFLIDGGKQTETAVGTDVERLEFPSAWRVVLITPHETAGLSGESELDAFRQLPGMTTATTGRLQGIVNDTLKPAVQRADFDRCSEALFEFGRVVGEYFAPVQGGVYADPRMGRLVDTLRREGIRGVGQTSWGPTIFALCRNELDAQSLAGRIGSHPDANSTNLQIASPLNTGAAIEVMEQ